MQILQCFEYLVRYEPEMHILQDSFTDQRMQICLHILEGYIQIFIILGADDSFQSDDIGVFQLGEDADLSISPLRIGGVLEGIEDLLESQLLLRSAVDHLPDVAVGTTA